MRLASALLLAILLFSLLARFFVFYPKEQLLPDNRQLTITSSLRSPPKIKGTLQSFILQAKGYETITVTAPSLPRLFYGEWVRVTGSIKHVVLQNHRTIASMSYPQISVFPDQGFLFSVRKRIVSQFERDLPFDDGRLLLGIVFGIKEPLSPSFEDQIRNVGLMHVIAASGMNVTLLVFGVLFVLERIFPRRVAICLSLGSIVLYAAFAGFEPSIVRASVMGGLALSATLLGRQYFGLWSLLLTGYVMLMLDPTLLSDIGFQLSFLATLGIMVFKPILSFHLPGQLAVVEEDFNTTLSAQLLTLPVILSSFGQFNLISVVVNVLVLWTVAPLMVIGGVAALISFIIPPLATLLLYLCLPLLLFFRAITAFLAQYSFSLHVNAFSTVTTIIYYVILISITLCVKKIRRKTE